MTTIVTQTSPSRRQRVPRSRSRSSSPESPMPTVLVVDPDQVVGFVDTHADYTTRTEVSGIIDALDGLAGG